MKAGLSEGFFYFIIILNVTLIPQFYSTHDLRIYHESNEDGHGPCDDFWSKNCDFTKTF